jgi:hypothetical protein
MERKEPMIQYDHWFGLEVAYSLPPGHTRGKKKRYRVLCFLHGNDECSVGPDKGKSIREAMGIHGPLAGSDFRPPTKYKSFKPASKLAMEKFIVVCPQLPYPGGKDAWRSHGNQENLMNIVQEIYKTENGDPHRTFLTGFSYGADDLWWMATHDSKIKWTALWAVDPTRAPNVLPVQPTILCMGSEEKKTLSQKIEPYEELGFHKYSTRYSGKYCYKTYRKNHWMTSWASYANDAFYNWLLGWEGEDS